MVRLLPLAQARGFAVRGLSLLVLAEQPSQVAAVEPVHSVRQNSWGTNPISQHGAVFVNVLAGSTYWSREK